MTKMLVVEDSNVKHAAKLLTIVVSVFLVGYFLEEATFMVPFEAYIRISAELLSVFVSFSIFGMTWYAHGKSRDDHSLFLGETFLLVGFLTLLHTFSYPFMPYFITPNSYNKAAFFLIESRLIFALLFLASAYIYKHSLPKLINKWVLLSSAIAISLISLAFALVYDDFLFSGYDFISFSSAMVFLSAIITVTILYASYLYTRKLKETGQKNLIFLIYGSIIVLFSNLVYFSFEFSGHFLIITGFFFMHLALYKTSVELPYEKLALAEDKLRLAAEEKYQNLFDNANDAIITADLEDRITSWNKAAEKLFGWTAQEVIGKTLSPLVVPEHLRAEREEIVRNALTAMTLTGIETVRLRKDGKKMDVSLTISPLLNGDKKVMGLSGIIRDITERKRMETELRESEERYRRLFETSQDGLILIDKQTGSIINVNPAIMELLGYSSKEFIGKRLKDVGLLKNIEDFQKTIQELNEIGFIHYDDMPLETKEGQSIDTEIYLIDMAKVIQCNVRNLTERKKAEKALEMALRDWHNTFNAIVDGVLILDSEGCIIKSNRVLESMMEINTENVIGQYCYKIIHNTSDFIEDCPFRQMKITGMREFFEFEDKERGLWFQVTIDPVCDESGKIINAVHIMRDVTEFKKAEETRYENIQLVLANKAKSNFLAHMSHELRTPLNSIIGFSELLNQKTIGELNEKQEHYIDNVLESSKHLLALINDILDLSKVEAGKIELVIEKISVPEAISDAVTLIKERAMKHSVVIKKDINPQLEIDADRQRIKQILFNLLSNAVKFSKPEGGTVTITAKKEDDMAKISISDTGIGIREENIRKLFTEFEQLDKGTSRKYEGTGLGLAITKKLVELHGGKIWAESKYGEGSTFTVILPIMQKPEGIR